MVGRCGQDASLSSKLTPVWPLVQVARDRGPELAGWKLTVVLGPARLQASPGWALSRPHPVLLQPKAPQQAPSASSAAAETITDGCVQRAGKRTKEA